MIELISLHIPKTAGTSFRHTLQSVYGKDGVIRIDIREQRSKEASGRAVSGYLPPGEVPHGIFASPLSRAICAFRRLKAVLTGFGKGILSRSVGMSENLNPIPPDTLPKAARVVHGHFIREALLEKYGLPPEIPVITWLRDPVERVISNYFYLHKVLHEAIERGNGPLDVLTRMERSLIEYAGQDMNRDRMTKFLKGMKLTDLAFVGIVEHMEEDLADLGNLLGWSVYKSYLHNTSVDRKSPVETEVKEEIAKLNHRDMELYSRALRMRDERRRHSGGCGA